MAAFGCGFVLGLFEFGRIAGIAVLGALGGMSIGVRICLFRAELLIPHPYWANWVITLVLGLVTLILVIAKQKAGIVSVFFPRLCCAVKHSSRGFPDTVRSLSWHVPDCPRHRPRREQAVWHEYGPQILL